MRYIIFIILFFTISALFSAADDISQISVVRIKYSGGGDWYGNKTTFINLFKRLNSEQQINVPVRENHSEVLDEDFFNHPIAYLSGHGNIRFSDQ